MVKTYLLKKAYKKATNTRICYFLDEFHIYLCRKIHKNLSYAIIIKHYKAFWKDKFLRMHYHFAYHTLDKIASLIMKMLGYITITAKEIVYIIKSSSGRY